MNKPSRPYSTDMEMFDIFSEDTTWYLIEWIDRNKETYGCTSYSTFEEAHKVYHDTSLAQYPAWHADHCPHFECGDKKRSFDDQD